MPYITYLVSTAASAYTRLSNHHRTRARYERRGIENLTWERRGVGVGVGYSQYTTETQSGLLHTVVARTPTNRVCWWWRRVLLWARRGMREEDLSTTSVS